MNSEGDKDVSIDRRTALKTGAGSLTTLLAGCLGDNTSTNTTDNPESLGNNSTKNNTNNEGNLSELNPSIVVDNQSPELGEKLNFTLDQETLQILEDKNPNFVWNIGGKQYDGVEVQKTVREIEMPVEVTTTYQNQEKVVNEMFEAEVYDNRQRRRKHMRIRPAVEQLKYGPRGSVAPGGKDEFIMEDEIGARRVINVLFEDEEKINQIKQGRASTYNTAALADIAEFEYENVVAKSGGRVTPKIFEFKDASGVIDDIESNASPEGRIRGRDVYLEQLERGEGGWLEREYMLAADPEENIVITAIADHEDFAGNAEDRMHLTLGAIDGDIRSLEEELEEDYGYIGSDTFQKPFMLAESLGSGYMGPASELFENLEMITGSKEPRNHNGFKCHSVFYDAEKGKIFQLDVGPFVNEDIYAENKLNNNKVIDEFDLTHEIQDEKGFLSGSYRI